MIQCSPVEMRKNLDAVEEFRKAGIDFVPIAVKNSVHKIDLIIQGQAVFDEMIAESNND
jgi:hypothetical protein